MPPSVRLRPVYEQDLPILFEYQNDPEANAMAAFPARDLLAFQEHWRKIFQDESVVAMSIVVDDCVVGNVGCWSQDKKRMIGYWIGKKFWGKGIASEMLSQFLKIVLDRPLFASVAKHNVASSRVLEKCGFLLCSEATDTLKNSHDGIEEMFYVLDAQNGK